MPSAASSSSAVASSSSGGVLRQRRRENNRMPAHHRKHPRPLLEHHREQHQEPVSQHPPASSSPKRHNNNNNNASSSRQQQPQPTSTRWWYHVVCEGAPAPIILLGWFMVGMVVLMYRYLHWPFQQLPREGGRERLPGRSIVTMFPAEIAVQESLPKFFQSYAIVTEHNQPARQAVQHVARQRRIVADAGSYDQKIALVAWEHDTFRQRMKFMDQRCGGTGWEDLYARAVANQDRTIAMSIKDESFQNTTTTNSTTSTSPSITWLADTLLLSCLLTSGYADGWIHRTVQPITSLTRGRQGVAAIRRMDTTPAAGTKQRIHSDLLWLPILSREQRRRQQQQKQQSERVVTPSTTLPLQMPEYWLAQDANKLHDPHQLHEIVKHWEEFLYQVIAQERAVDSSRWVLWNAACQPTERQALAATQKLVATTCLEENNKTSANISEPADDEEEECCSFYDPNVKP